MRCWECGREFTPTFTVIPGYYVACAECVNRLSVRAFMALQTGHVRQENFQDLLSAPTELKEKETLLDPLDEEVHAHPYLFQKPWRIGVFYEDEVLATI